jgi:hypothetical protein
MARMRVGALLLACAAAAFVGSCGAEDKSGACTGTMNGAYFRLEIGNYLTDTSIDVRINGRFIGKVGKGQNNPNDGRIDATVKKLGEFPVCDKMVIDARGSSGTYSQKICSKPAYLSPGCSGGGLDFCWETLSLVPQLPCSECNVFAPAQPTCPCGVGSDPANSWEKC